MRLRDILLAAAAAVIPLKIIRIFLDYKSQPQGRATLETWNLYNTVYSSRDHTGDIFKSQNLERWLNPDANYFQPGAAHGHWLARKVKPGRNLTAYDFSPKVINQLIKKGIQAKQINLNEIIEGNKLRYEEQLKRDIANATNIICIHILPYLEPEALVLFMVASLNNAAPGSVFVIQGNFNREKLHDVKGSVPFNYFLSFFGPRTDIVIPFIKEFNENDQVFVARKVNK